MSLDKALVSAPNNLLALTLYGNVDGNSENTSEARVQLERCIKFILFIQLLTQSWKLVLILAWQSLKKHWAAQELYWKDTHNLEMERFIMWSLSDDWKIKTMNSGNMSNINKPGQMIHLKYRNKSSLGKINLRLWYIEYFKRSKICHLKGYLPLGFFKLMPPRRIWCSDHGIDFDFIAEHQSLFHLITIPITLSNWANCLPITYSIGSIHMALYGSKTISYGLSEEMGSKAIKPLLIYLLRALEVYMARYAIFLIYLGKRWVLSAYLSACSMASFVYSNEAWLSECSSSFDLLAELDRIWILSF